MKKKRKKILKVGSGPLQAFNRHAGTHEDQYETSKKRRKSSKKAIQEAISDLPNDKDH